MTSKWKYKISVRAVILSLSSYFVFPFVKPGDRLKVGGRGFSVPDDLSLEEFTTFCSSFSAGADKRSTTSVSTAKRLADDAWRPLLGRLGRDATGRVRRSARVHANSGSAQALSARWQNRSLSRTPCSTWRECCRTRVHRDLLKELLDQGWRGPYNGEECHLR
jgi:hypothetical protein